MKYWTPNIDDPTLKVALSIPGCAPRTVQEHRNRLETLIARQIEAHDLENGQGNALRQLRDLIPDSILRYQDSTTDPSTLAWVLADHLDEAPMATIEDVDGSHDPELQEAASELHLMERLVALTQAF